jgi:hypothetical protein
MHIVAIHNLPEDKEALAPTLAAVLGSTVYEALSRLKSSGKGPLVVGVSAAITPSEDLVMKLTHGGFNAILLKEDEFDIEARQFVVRKFSLSENMLLVESRREESLAVTYSNIDLIIRGTSIAQTTATETVKEKKFDPGMALLTSGLKMTKTTERAIESTAQTREGFLLLYAGDLKTLLFRESGLLYDSLGSYRKSTSQGNFSYLLEELRRRCPEAVYDDRLISRTGQIQLLGRALTPEEHLVIATSLLAKVLR